MEIIRSCESWSIYVGFSFLKLACVRWRLFKHKRNTTKIIRKKTKLSRNSLNFPNFNVPRSIAAVFASWAGSCNLDWFSVRRHKQIEEEEMENLFVGLRRSHRQQIKSKINSTRTTNFQSDFVFLLCSFLMYKTQRFSLAFHLVDLFGFRWLFLHADVPFHLSTWRLVLRLFHSFDLTKSTSARRLRWWWCWSGGGSGRTRSYCSHWFMHSTRYTIHEYIGTHEMLKIAQVICSICVVSVHSRKDRINHMAHIERGTWTGCRDPIRTLNELKFGMVIPQLRAPDLQ